MKRKFLLFTALISTALLINAQTTIFNETFESVIEPNLPTSWSKVDIDGNGTSWAAGDSTYDTNPMGFSGNTAVAIFQTNDSNNLLISPAISLPASGSLSLSYLIGAWTYNGFLAIDNYYAVYVLPASSIFTGTEIPVFEETFSVGDIALPRTVNLSAYAGQNVKLYFRQTSKLYRAIAVLDNVKITQGTLGTSEVSDKNEIGIYPNPATDFLTIKSKSKIDKVEIFDGAGRKLSIELNDNKIDVRSLQSGNYVLKIGTKDGIKTEKFIRK
ncbi:T9SS-dependent choice-of-anchor J family protein [Chryseobacterium limigenitum]|uniref:Por secretion system C-terminal sorting domain-containing protein n=1 Tax=Chryseobacterium limigenitum TaxID=1612149 RepID=A0A1K2IBU7_9FLAO|nr:T9SS type A sorting domain-containing protein [Chryseobacterium limigenitum]SFZ89885.1 Por secretion system C-terminal sorting domain-containing protein [Chryseobacterium limigenitum]